ncbi:MAG: UvrD-helicase domain-containing protein, partial [Bdellovibrionales bacterium]|nr:UvrD-helicase domain-containing protein [Bdellovibrionales bacterium]
MNINWLQNLNEQQRQAVLQTEGPLLILAGAGSGKTTVLVSRTGYILSQHLATAAEVLVLTFTNKAARELKERVSHKLGQQGQKVWAGTFHGWGLDFLKKNYKLAGLPQRFGLLDATDARSLLKDLVKERQHYAKSNFDVEILQNVLSDIRAGKSLSPKLDEAYLDMADWLLPAYTAKMHSLGLIDFDGLILKPTEILKQHENLAKKYQQKYKYIMVDEFQDTNKMQLDLVLSLCNSNSNIAVVGDDDQSIYGWRGAEIQNILGFPKLFKNCHVVRLETNYRSTPQILTMANSIIHRNEERHKKQLVPNAHAGSGPLPEVFIFDHEEAECEEITQLILDYHKKGFAYKDIAVLFRSNSQGALLEGYLKRSNIEYDLTGGPALIDRKEVRDVLAYIRTAIVPNDIALRRILNTPHRGIGDTSIHKVIDYQKEHELSFLQAIKLWHKTDINEKV